MKDLGIAIFLGFLQGITEWLPISSEGVLVVASMAFFGHELDQSVSYALWLHSGTSLAAFYVFRKEMTETIREFLLFNRERSARSNFLFLATVFSVIVGAILMPYAKNIPFGFESETMPLIGILMFFTGLIQLKKPRNGVRFEEHLLRTDAFFAGIAQGFSILPGLSRSALTLSCLAWRGLDHQSALRLSFMMSIPVTLGVSLLQGVIGEVIVSKEILIAAGVSLITGITSMKILLLLTQKINFGFFMVLTGLLIIIGSNL